MQGGLFFIELVPTMYAISESVIPGSSQLRDFTGHKLPSGFCYTNLFLGPHDNLSIPC